MNKLWVSSSQGEKGVPGIPLKEDRIYYLNTDTLNKWIRLDSRVWAKLMGNVGRNEIRIKGDKIRASGVFFFKEGILRAINGEDPRNIVIVYRVPMPSRATKKFHLKIEDNKVWITFSEYKVRVKHEEIFEITNYITKIYPKNKLKDMVKEAFTRIWKEFE